MRFPRRTASVVGSVRLPGSADFTTLAAGQPSTLPTWWTCIQASNGYTVQTGTSSLAIVGSGNNIARAGKALDAWPVGLVVDPAITNRLAADSASYPRDPSAWPIAESGTVSYSAFAGTDAAGGIGTAKRVTAASGSNWTKQYSYSAASVARTASIWTVSGTPGGLIQWRTNGAPGATADGPSPSNSWFRRTATYAGTQQLIVSADGRDLTAYGGIVAGARDAAVDFAQIEDLPYATEVALGAGVRAAGYYSLPLASIVDQSGRIAIEIDFRPRGADADYTFPIELLYVDASNKIELVSASSSPFVAVTIGGSTFTSQVGAAWDRWARSKVTVIAGGGGRTEIYWATRLDAGDGTYPGWIPVETPIGYSDTAQGNFPTIGTGYVLASGTGTNTFAAWLYAVNGYRAGWRKVMM